MRILHNRVALMLVLAVGLIGWSFVHAQGEKKMQSQAIQPKHVMITPDDIKWVDAPPSVPPGAKMAVLEGDPAKPGPFTMRIKFPADYKVPPHWHPRIEHTTCSMTRGSASRREKVS